MPTDMSHNNYSMAFDVNSYIYEALGKSLQKIHINQR